MKTKNAFTLIELLIVVLIIAILAAIAVPNFLEFQVRAKISRVMSDQRTLATAIEGYTVDNNRPPIDANIGASLGLWTQSTRDRALHQLTTPIAYISTIPIDPFVEKAKLNSVGNQLDEVSDNYHCMEDHPNSSNWVNAKNEGYTWYVRSLGPDHKAYAPFFTGMIVNNDTQNIYDPTNGTISKGNIFRTNKGVFDGSGVGG